jgi:hypothetical protein
MQTLFLGLYTFHHKNPPSAAANISLEILPLPSSIIIDLIFSNRKTITIRFKVNVSRSLLPRESIMKWTGMLMMAGLLFLLATGPGSGQDEKAYRLVSSEKLESILQGMNISFKKIAGKTEGIYFYDYERSKFKIRLHNYNGKDLWIDALFTDKTTLEEINRWNRKAKFSRAVLIKDKDRETISLESQVDCLGGVTDGIIRLFINRFDGEISEFVKFLAK